MSYYLTLLKKWICEEVKKSVALSNLSISYTWKNILKSVALSNLSISYTWKNIKKVLHYQLLVFPIHEKI